MCIWKVPLRGETQYKKNTQALSDLFHKMIL